MPGTTGWTTADKHGTSPASRAPWGVEAIIDLYGCRRGTLENEHTIRRFLADLVGAIGMTAHGGPELIRFGQGDLHGWSAKQWIETSSVIVHCDEGRHRRCFIDVFSCAPFDAGEAAAVAVDHFGGRATVRVIERGAAI